MSLAIVARDVRDVRDVVVTSSDAHVAMFTFVWRPARCELG